MCHQSSCEHFSDEDATAAEENLLVYCKPVELYNILHRRAIHNPSFLRRCLRFKIQARRKRNKRLRAGIVIFNYRDRNNVHQKVEVTEDFSCPFCLMQCASFKGLRLHLCSSHDLFNFEFWVIEEYQAVNVSVKVDMLRSKVLTEEADPRLWTFFFCPKPRRRQPKYSAQNRKHVQVEFLEFDPSQLASEGLQKGLQEVENAMQNGVHEAENSYPDDPNTAECLEHVASSFNVSGTPTSMAQSSIDHECIKSSAGSDPAILQMSKTKKIVVERSESRNRGQLLRRQFYHSHRVQPMAVDQVLSERDSEDEVDDDIADFEDRRMLDDFVDVTKDEKDLMHLWNSFVRKQRVLADGHVPWACEAFSKHNSKKLVETPPLFWCWRLFMIKLWNHGLLDASTMNNCNVILERYRNGGPDVKRKTDPAN